MKCNVAVVPGDGIGPDIVAEAVKVLKIVLKLIDLNMNMQLQVDVQLIRQEKHFQKKH